MIYVYTSISNGFDNLRAPLVVSKSARYICFTNVPNLSSVEPWEFRPLPDIGNHSRSNRIPKILPHLMLPEDAEYSIYHDGNFGLTKFPEEVIESLLRSHDWAAHRHPCRTCIYEEAEVLLRENIGTAALVSSQIGRYQEVAYPAHAGLWANGFLVRRHSDAVKSVCEEWWKEFSGGCERDQIAFPFARHRMGLQVNTIGGVIYSSPFVHFWWHAAWKDQPCNRDFKEARKRLSGTLCRLNELTGTRLEYRVYE
jgi:hypothetical protein